MGSCFYTGCLSNIYVSVRRITYFFVVGEGLVVTDARDDDDDGDDNDDNDNRDDERIYKANLDVGTSLKCCS